MISNFTEKCSYQCLVEGLSYLLITVSSFWAQHKFRIMHLQFRMKWIIAILFNLMPCENSMYGWIWTYLVKFPVAKWLNSALHSDVMFQRKFGSQTPSHLLKIGFKGREYFKKWMNYHIFETVFQKVIITKTHQATSPK